MIAFLEGKIIKIDPTFVILEVNHIGYEIRISLNTYKSIKNIEQVKLHTYYHITNDAHILFGFYDIAEKKRFLNLISISNVGGSTALMVLSSLTSEELYHAVMKEDVHTIKNVKGIGEKTAKRIILELKDKMSKEGIILSTDGIKPTSINHQIKSEALNALVNLGLPRGVTEKKIDQILLDNPNIELENLIKIVLKGF